MITPPTLEQLADFEGVPVDSLDPYSEQALLQATALMQIALTTDFDESSIADDPFKMNVLDWGICSMAEAICIGKGYRAAAINPYYTETIGSYSYAKASSRAAAGEETGIAWFDQAVNLLSLGDLEDIQAFDGISVFERDVTGYGIVTGRPYVIGPADDLELPVSIPAFGVQGEQ